MFLNESQSERAEYVDYEEGGPLSVPQLVADHQEMLKRINTEEKGVTEKAASSAQKPVRVALLYKRGAQPDEQVLNFVEAQLMANGHQVFIDRRLAFSLAWAKEIERQVCEADVVIPLLSATSIENEMLSYEVVLAHEAAQQQEGKPRLLPVRVNFTGQLPEELARILDSVPQVLWEGVPNDQRLAAEVMAGVRDPLAIRPALRIEELEPPIGALRPNSQFYIARPIDQEFYAAIARRDSVVLVKGARQMGKTSLLARGLQRARELGYKAVLSDFLAFNTSQFASADIFYMSLCELIADQLQLEVTPDSTWKSNRSPNLNFQDYMRNAVLGKLSVPLIWGLDEVDRLFTCSFASDVFGLLRSWHNARATDPSSPWSQLTLAIAHATEPHLFIADLERSPFNVGTRLTLQDFTHDEIVHLNRLYGFPLRGEAEVARLFQIVGGQPYLVHYSLFLLVKKTYDLAALERHADRDEGPFHEQLGRLLLVLARDPDLCEVVRNLLRGHSSPDLKSFYRLRSGGVIIGDTPDDAQFRCGVYASYLKRHLL